MKTVSPFVVVTAICFGLFSSKLRVNATEPFDEYVGNWLFREDRRQLSTGFEDTEKGGVILFENYRAICGLVRRKWMFHFDQDKMKYVGTLTTRFGRDVSETHIIGEWDDETSTMFWTLETDLLDTKIRHRFLEGKLVVTTLPKEDDSNRKPWREHGTFTPTARE